MATPTSHLHRHTGTHLGVHRLRTSHERLFYIKRSNQTTRQDPGESHLLLPELPSQKPRSSGLWGAPGGERSLLPPPIKPCSTEEPQMDTEEPGQQDHQDRSVHTHSGQA